MPPRVLVMLGGIPLHGQERGNIQVFTALKDAGVECLFVTHKTYGHESIQPALDRLGLPWTVATYPRPLRRGMSAREWTGRLRQIVVGNLEFWRVGRRFRPTHIHVCNEGHFAMLLPAVRALGAPVVFRLGDEPRQHRPVFREFWRRVILPSVDRWVAISDYVRGKLLAAGADPQAVRVIYNYPPERRPATSETALGGSAGATRGDEVLMEARHRPFEGRSVVYMGQLTEDKGVGLLVDAALRLCRERTDVRFLIAGDYSWQNPFAEGLMGQVEASGLADRIRFLGYVDDVPALLELAEIHCAPSVREEPLGNVVLEAKKASVPSVVFPSGGLPEMIVEGGADGFVCRTKSVDALTDGLNHYLNLSEGELVSASRAAAASLQRLGIKRGAFKRKWLDVYDDAGAGSPTNVTASTAKAVLDPSQSRLKP